MRTFHITRWVGIIVLAAVLYFLFSEVLFYLFTGHFLFNFQSVLTYLPIRVAEIKYLFASDVPNLWQYGVVLGFVVLTGLIVLFIFSYWTMSKLFGKNSDQG